MPLAAIKTNEMLIRNISIFLLLLTLISCHNNEMKLTMTDIQISQLDSLKNTYKFTDKDWDKRGLIPSEKSLSDKMDRLLNDCLGELISTQNKNLTQKDYKKILNRGLKRFHKLDFDTEEREFIADKFDEIAKIIRIDFSEDLNIWLYGRLMVKLGTIFNKESKAIDIKTIKCTDCQESLNKLIVRTEENIPEYWTIVKCNKCGNLNLFPAQGNIKESRFENCTWIKSFAKPEFDSVQIELKLKEMKMNK